MRSQRSPLLKICCGFAIPFPGSPQSFVPASEALELSEYRRQSEAETKFRRRLASKALEPQILDLVVLAGLGDDDIVDLAAGLVIETVDVGPGGAIETLEGAAVEDVIVENGLNVEVAAAGRVV